jgi:hypothetical protein
VRDSGQRCLRFALDERRLKIKELAPAGHGSDLVHLDPRGRSGQAGWRCCVVDNNAAGTGFGCFERLSEYDSHRLPFVTDLVALHRQEGLGNERQPGTRQAWHILLREDTYHTVFTERRSRLYHLDPTCRLGGCDEHCVKRLAHAMVGRIASVAGDLGAPVRAW